MKLRLAYTKKGEARYIAHLDLTRVFDRALRRAEIPVAFSEGFNPHPKIAFGPPLPVGVEGEQEYVDIGLKESEDEFQGSNDQENVIRDIAARLQKQLPAGINIAGYGSYTAGTKALMAVINLARYRTTVPFLETVDLEVVREACRHWLLQEEVISVRFQQGKRNERDIRPYVKAIEVLPSQKTINSADINIDIVTGNSGSVRPVEILESIKQTEKLPIDVPGVTTIRTGVYIEQADGSLLTPLGILY